MSLHQVAVLQCLHRSTSFRKSTRLLAVLALRLLDETKQSREPEQRACWERTPGNRHNTELLALIPALYRRLQFHRGG